jgi:hypothetical protein
MSVADHPLTWSRHARAERECHWQSAVTWPDGTSAATLAEVTRRLHDNVPRDRCRVRCMTRWQLAERSPLTSTGRY